jgi:hypothetical protein
MDKGQWKSLKVALSDGQVHNSIFSQCLDLVVSFKHRLKNKGYISNILTFKANSGIITFKIVIFQGNKLEKKCLYSRCLCMEMVVLVI